MQTRFRISEEHSFAQLRFRRANGTIIDKAIYLDDLMKPANVTDELLSKDITPTVYGDLAVVELLVQAQRNALRQQTRRRFPFSTSAGSNLVGNYIRGSTCRCGSSI